MKDNAYLKWLASTDSCWWVDSAAVGEAEEALANGATGATVNPLLVNKSLRADPAFWAPYVRDVSGLSGDEYVEELVRRVTLRVAEVFRPVYEATEGRQGYVCAQVNPSLAARTAEMIAMAKRFGAWAPNVAVKLPVTAAGLDALEECAAAGLTTVATVSFTAAQAAHAARRQTLGASRAERNGSAAPKAAFSVIMVGRLDDYLRDVALDRKAAVKPEDILWAGTAAIKNAYAEVKAQGYTSSLMPAGMRGGYHTEQLAGADMSLSIGPKIQDMLNGSETKEHIDDPIPSDVLSRLKTIPEFVRAYEVGGLEPQDFITFGATQRTLSQFVEAGWQGIKDFKLD
jgi:transaldolase